MALAAVLATLEELRRPGFFERLTSLGDALTAGLTAAADEAGIGAHARGVGPMLQLVFAEHPVENYRDFARSSDDRRYREFWRGMVDRGVMFVPQPTGCWFVSGAHSDEDIATTLEAATTVLMTIAARPPDHVTGARA
jgi:glutamate-1-semialdehyde 2,1-aminomutase